MLPEQIAKFLENEDFKRLSAKLDEAMINDYIYPRNKTEISHIIAEIVELTYKKGRADERYYNGGPLFTLYDKPE